MSYGLRLLRRAVRKAGTQAQLSRLTGIPESHVSEAMRGIRSVPAAWVLRLATVAEVDPGQALTGWDRERARKSSGGPSPVC